MLKTKTQGIILLTIAILASIFSPRAYSSDDSKPSIKFAQTTHDFGKIHEKGGKVSHDFTFTNDGKGNLVITDATAQCGCTKPTFPENPIAPGKDGVVKVTYNPLGRPGSFEKTVTVKTNGHPKKTRLKIKGEVIP